MSKLVLIVSSILFFQFAWANQESKDPFKKFSIHELQNGMKLVLAPNEHSKNVKLKLVVGTGRWSEKWDNLHSNHILEHMLFKDGSIEGNKSYLEVIKEAGGDVNAYVTNSHTAYYTTINHDKADWLVEKFHSMLFYRELEKNELNLAKASVVLEIGKPFIFNRWLGSNSLGKLFSNYFPDKSFREEEFGEGKFPYGREDERLAVKRINLEHVKNVYKEYYHPKNMTIYLAGQFNEKSMLKVFQNKFGTIQLPDGKYLSKIEAQNRSNGVFKSRPNVFSDSANISYGTTLFKRDATDLLVLDSYLNFVAHRLMIELRNKKGETYTASSYVSYDYKAGYGYVTFNTQEEKFKKNKAVLMQMIHDEAIAGKFADNLIGDAKNLFLKERYEIKDVDANGVLDLAETFLEFREDFKEKNSPYDLLSKVSPEEYRNRLKNVFETEGRYTSETVPPLFFEFDLICLLILSIMGAIYTFRKIMHNHDETGAIIWFYKTFTSPGKVFEVSTLFIYSLLISYFVTQPFEYFYESTDFYSSNVFVNSYADTVLQMFLFCGIFMWSLSRVPTKLLFSGKGFVMKALIFKEYSFDFDSISEVASIPSAKKYHPKLLFKTHFAFQSCCNDWFFWRRNLFIQLKNGESFVLNVRDAKALKEKIELEIAKSKAEENGGVEQLELELQGSFSKAA